MAETIYLGGSMKIEHLPFNVVRITHHKNGVLVHEWELTDFECVYLRMLLNEDWGNVEEWKDWNWGNLPGDEPPIPLPDWK